MSIQFSKLSTITRLFIGAALFVLACIGLGVSLTNFSEGSQLPIKTLRIVIDPVQREELFDQLLKFSDKHAFKYNLTDYGGQGKHFLVYILGDNIKILTVETSDVLDTFSIRFYAPSPGGQAPDKQMVNELVHDLKNFIVSIPNIKITEE